LTRVLLSDSTSRVVPDRTNLDGPETRGWDARRERDCLVQIFSAHEVEPAELFLGFGKRAVGGDGLPVTDAKLLAFFGLVE
jgi:hypothetical protein